MPYHQMFKYIYNIMLFMIGFAIGLPIGQLISQYYYDLWQSSSFDAICRKHQMFEYAYYVILFMVGSAIGFPIGQLIKKYYYLCRSINIDIDCCE